MSQLLLGKSVSDGLPFGLKLVPKKTLATHIFGISGSRKTSLQLHLIKSAKIQDVKTQVVIFSHEGDELALRKDFDFILFGNEGEIPIDVKIGKHVGEQVRKSGVDVIIDLTSIKTEKERDGYMADVLDGLMLDNDRRFWKNTLIVMIDEVQIYCNSTASKARDAIINLVTLGRKRSIVSIFASHQLKDMYYQARNEIGNNIIGYLKNPSQRLAACDLLMVPKSEADTIASFQNEPHGRFYAEGYDLSSPAKVFILENTPYPDLDGEIPKISLQGMQKADALRDSLNIKDQMSVESQLRFEITELRSKNDQLSLNQMSTAMIERLYKEGISEGYRQATNTLAKKVSDFIQENTGIGGLFKRHAVIINKIQRPDGKYDLVMET